MAHRTGRYALAAAVLAVGTAVAMPVAGAQAHRTAGAGPGFAQHQQQLEQALALRITQIEKLQSEVQSSTALSQAHEQLLSGRLGGELGTLQSLASSVPNDTTGSELRQASQEMLQGDRVFAVMTPQVFETIEGDQLAAQVASLQQGLATLQDAVSSLAGDPGQRAAEAHLTNYENRLSTATKATSYAAGTVLSNMLAQQPADWPRDQHVFTNANKVLLKVNISLAYAAYDASEIGLLTGGSTSGSVSGASS